MEKNTKQQGVEAQAASAPAVKPKFRLHEDVSLPIDGLPKLVQQFIEEVTRTYRCPQEFVTCAVFAAVATAIGSRVKTFDGVYKNALVLWFVNVANSGTNKTAPVKCVLEPLSKINSENYQVFERELAEWRADKDRDESKVPAYNQLLISDCTEEARTCVLKSSRTGVLAHYPEIKGFFDDLDRYNKSGSISRVLRLFDTDQLIVNRKSDIIPTLIERVFMNIIGDIQPALLKCTFGSDLFVNNGLNQRFLFAMPKVIEYPFRMNIELNTSILQSWEDFIRDLYTRDYTGFDVIEFSSECNDLYTEYHDELQRRKSVNSENGYLVSIFGKMQIQVQRLAGLVHLMEMVNPEKPYTYRYISGDAMEYAIRCMNYFEKTAMAVYERIFDVSTFGSGHSQAQIIRDFHKAIPIGNITQFAKSIGKDKGYISKILSSAK